ncbi:MAG TPA: DNA polymerase [Dehalococcoidia bacterium]|nr:DNA polymerase [Dehalococcoidia bacterium]
MTHKQHEAAIAAGAKCEECPLYGCGQGPVPPTKAAGDPLLILIGEAPGRHEVEQGKPFVGKSGDELKAALRMANTRREDCHITNVILCRPPDDLNDYLKVCARRGWHNPITCCSPRLGREIEETDTTVIMPVGGKALQAVCERYGIDYGKGKDQTGVIKSGTILKQHGAPIEITQRSITDSVLNDVNYSDVGISASGVITKWENKTTTKIICPSLHPAFAMRGAKDYKFVIREDLARGARIAKRGHVLHVPFTSHTYVDGRWPARAALQDIEMRLEEMRTKAKWAAVDIETDSKWMHLANIRCVGIGADIDGEEVVVVVPFRWRDGREYWEDGMHLLRAQHAVSITLSALRCVYHNGAYDTAVMLRHGFIPDDERMKQWGDTLLADHCTDHQSLPHDLGAVTRRNFEVRMWKDDADAKDAFNVADDQSLHNYNADDVIWTKRLWPKLVTRMKRLGTTKAFKVDTKLAPIYREMGQMGLYINERVRGDLAVQVRHVIKEKEDRFRLAAGVEDEFNLRSPPQVGRWLFGPKSKGGLALRPPLNTDGKDFKDGDDPSTGTPSLLRIIDDGQAVDDVKEALNALIEYRAAEKLRSSYIDNVPVIPYGHAFEKLGTVPAVIDPYTGKVILEERPLLSHLLINWKLHITPSGRTSSSPNCQNIPAVAFGGIKIKPMYVAPPGHCFVGSDLEQVEARVYLALSGDRLDRWVLDQGLDIHAFTAAIIFTGERDATSPIVMKEYHRISDMPKEQKKFMRGVAKTIRYGECYGAEEGKLFDIFKVARDKVTLEPLFPTVTPEDASEWHRAWHNAHPETHRWQAECFAFERQHKFMYSLLHGRRRFFPGGPSKRNAVPNMLIQGTAGAIKNKGMLEIYERIPFRSWSPHTGLCLDIHDDIKVIVPNERAEEAAAIIEECFRWEYNGVEFPPDAAAASWDLAGQG